MTYFFIKSAEISRFITKGFVNCMNISGGIFNKLLLPSGKVTVDIFRYLLKVLFWTIILAVILGLGCNKNTFTEIEVLADMRRHYLANRKAPKTGTGIEKSSLYVASIDVRIFLLLLL
jgi:hypothetical protein